MFRSTDLSNWLGGGTRRRELDETRRQWAEVDALWRESPLAGAGFSDLSLAVVQQVIADSERCPAVPILLAADHAVQKLLLDEELNELVPDWPIIDGDAAIAANVRALLVRRRRWAEDFERMLGVFGRGVLGAFVPLFDALPSSCFEAWGEEGDGALGVPLIDLVERPAEVVERLVLLPYDDAAMEREVFHRLRTQLVANVLVASGFPPDIDPRTVASKLILPTRHKGASGVELAEVYLAHTPLLALLQLPVPFEVPEQLRFEHCHIVGGTGHGKTQLLQRMIHADLMAAQKDGRSVVVIDSQGDLINKLVRLELFDPSVAGSLADRLVLIDPADVEYPAALNLFDAHLERTKDYGPVDRERVLNGVVALYETFFGEMLGAELTQKQNVVFRYLARLMITIPGATIHTLMQIMEDGAPWKPQMAQLQGSARHFFETEFFAPSFAATKKQILRRLWGVLSTPAFERMFIQPENKLDLYEAMNEGKIILVSTAKDLLKADGSALLGRFFIAMIAQAALERSVIKPEERTPTFVYIDEAQEYFGDDVETILNQARKYRVGLTLAHQTLDQLSPRLRAGLHANTSLKFAGGVSARDARALAEELHTTPDFIESMRRLHDRSEFAAWLKNVTPSALRLSSPLGYLERQPTLTDDAYDQLLEQNRERYGGELLEQPTPEPRPAPKPTEREQSPNDPKNRAIAPTVEPVSAAREEHAQPFRPPVPPMQEREQGKGGRKHRYLQALVKELGEQQGFLATIEAPVEGGQVDVLLSREGVRVAFEVSVTTPTDYERANIRKCLDAGFEHVALLMARTAGPHHRLKAGILNGIGEGEAARVTCLSPEELPDYILAIAAPAPAETLVKGYKVKVTHSNITEAEVAVRRGAIARVVNRSLVKHAN